MTETHPWAEAWTALSPQRRAALHARIVDREPVEELAGRLGRTVADTEALVGSTLVAFRREVVLGIGTGYGEECGSLVLRLVDSAGERLTRPDRRALASHADGCPQCAAAVGEMLEMDARLRDGLILLVGGQVPAAVSVPAPRTPVAGGLLSSPARRRLGLGLGLAVAAVTAAALLSTTGTDSTPGDLAAEESPVLDTTTVDEGATTVDEDADATAGDDASRVDRPGARTASRTPVAVDAATAAAAPSAGGRAPQGTGTGASGNPAGQGGNPGGGTSGGTGGDPGGNPGGGDPGDPGDPGPTPPLDVAVDTETGSVTLTLGLLGDPIVISTPPITQPDRKVNKR